MPLRCSVAAVSAICTLAGRCSSATGCPTTAPAPHSVCASRVRRPGPLGSGTIAPSSARRRISRQELSNRDSIERPMELSGSTRMTAASRGNGQPARLAAPRTVATSERPESRTSTSSSRSRSRSATAVDWACT